MLGVQKFILCSLITLICVSNSVDAISVGTDIKNLMPGVPLRISSNGQENLNIFCYEGVPKNILQIWQTVNLGTTLDPSDYELYISTTPVSVFEEYELRRSSWSVPLFTWRSKNVKLEPFNRTCIGIVTSYDYNIHVHIIRVDFWKLSYLLLGTFLFFSAGRLSRNPFFYYVLGVTFGTTTSFLILIYFTSRLIPKKPFMYGFLVGGWTIGVYLFQMLWENIRIIAVSYQSHVLVYTTVMALLSFVICYRVGPVSDPRSINLIKWTLQLIGLLLVFASSHFQEAAVVLILMILSYHNFPRDWSSYFLSIWRRKFPPKVSLLTEDEYHEQGARETVRALDELRKHCSSPECNQWKVMLKLKKPIRYPNKRFAEFMEGKSHLDDREILEFEAHSTKDSLDYTDDEDEDEENED